MTEINVLGTTMYFSGAPTQRNWNPKFYRQCKLAGLNIEDAGKSADIKVQVGGAPTQRNWNPKFYRQCKLAGPQHRR
ncbi:hypothetical protein CKX96_11090 [Staphylococcus argenteus]|nr:hypothetical protein CJ017_05035 [Staphylococcus argenteus]ATZ86859.1 hypothetical protein CKO49_05055 [Staphylococcus argenteus]KAA0802226.1 hypothetical protein DVU64_00835 [Staphylococcus argenteus]MZG24526.1 hypothetical protein [Staphylococcus argenteus]PSH06386.1 hypothetical protein CKX96_11090 [Staphylococcus argenteus]